MAHIWCNIYDVNPKPQPKNRWISRPYIQKPTIMLWHEILKVFLIILNLEEYSKLIVITWHWYNSYFDIFYLQVNSNYYYYYYYYYSNSNSFIRIFEDVQINFKQLPIKICA
jgi:hypothetical protein